MAETNEFKIVGTISSIESVTRTAKNDPSKTYKVHTLLIENDRTATRSYKNKDDETKTAYGSKKEFVKVEFFNNMMIESFSKLDFVEITGYLGGSEWTTPEGIIKYIQKNSGVYIKHADLNSGYPSHTGKITVEDKSVFVPKKEDLPFPEPLESDDYGDLPFVLTALVGIGSMFII